MQFFLDFLQINAQDKTFDNGSKSYFCENLKKHFHRCNYHVGKNSNFIHKTKHG